MGDIKFVEETHKVLRATEQHAQPKVQVSQQRLYHQLTIPGAPLAKRVATVAVP